jgi:hypothetical protein
MEAFWLYWKMIRKQSDNIDKFQIKAERESFVWSWAARILPTVALLIVGICHFFGFNDLRDILINISLISFAIIAVIWWWWALDKIITTIKYLRSTQDKFQTVMEELKKFRRDIGGK